MPVTNEGVWGHIRAGCRVGLRCLGGLALVVSLTAATCTSGVGVPLRATAASVAEMAARTVRQSSYRTETAVWFGDSVEVPLARGAVDGDHFRTTTDLGEIIEAALDDLPDPGLAPEQDTAGGDYRPRMDATVELVADCSTLYVRASLGAGPPDPSLYGKDAAAPTEIARMGEGWARIDDPGVRLVDVLHHLTGHANPDPRELLALLTDVDIVEDLGGKSDGGQDLGGLTVEVPMEVLLDVLGKQPDELIEGADGYTQGLVRRAAALPVPVEVWINEDRLVHQISFQLKPDDMAEALGEDEAQLVQAFQAAGLEELGRVYTVDYFGYDEAPTIPVPEEAFELSKDFLMMPSKAAR